MLLRKRKRKMAGNKALRTIIGDFWAAIQKNDLNAANFCYLMYERLNNRAADGFAVEEGDFFEAIALNLLGLGFHYVSPDVR